LFTKKVQLTSD